MKEGEICFPARNPKLYMKVHWCSELLFAQWGVQIVGSFPAGLASLCTGIGLKWCLKGRLAIHSLKVNNLQNESGVCSIYQPYLRHLTCKSVHLCSFCWCTLSDADSHDFWSFTNVRLKQTHSANRQLTYEWCCTCNCNVWIQCFTQCFVYHWQKLLIGF